MTTSLLTRNLPTTGISSQVAVLEPTKKGWFNDPLGQHRFRFHDGQEWTTHTTHFGPVPCRGCR